GGQGLGARHRDQRSQRPLGAAGRGELQEVIAPAAARVGPPRPWFLFHCELGDNLPSMLAKSRWRRTAALAAAFGVALSIGTAARRAQAQAPVPGDTNAARTHY